MILTDGALGRYICGPGADAGYKSAQFEDSAREAPADNSVRIIFDDEMRLARIEQ